MIWPAFLLALALTAAAVGTPAVALSPDVVERVRYIRGIMLQGMGELVCGPGLQRCAPATSEELANPPLTDEETYRVLSVGALDAYAAHCGLDWRTRSFEPMMAWWRAVARKTERQAALIAALHGVGQDMALTAAADQPCDAARRSTVDAQLDFRP